MPAKPYGLRDSKVQSQGLMVTHIPNSAAPKVFADRTQIQQVLVNLTVNAIQAMAQAGTPQRSLVISTALSDPHTLCCTLEDSGPGIKPEHLDRLFDSFFTTKDGGMGLGLAISRLIIEAHGGPFESTMNRPTAALVSASRCRRRCHS